MMIICKEIIVEKNNRGYKKIQKDPIRILAKLFFSDKIETVEEKPFAKEDVESFMINGFSPKMEYTKLIFKIRNKTYYVNKVVTLE